ncbi:reticulon family protein [Hibiscus syriacus]|uniref:Reticulon family protein n=1 Tax=Hibiscus syriacus TaxID=106335 RepID=A0A6A3AXC1_HIBSY|nr:reticulon family protein [Hibiscus syriacus]
MDSPPPLLKCPPNPIYLLYRTILGLGYSIAVALGFLLLLSIILLASYICCRPSSSPVRAFPPNPAAGYDGIVLPRVIFIDEDDATLVLGLDEAAINSYPKFQFSKETVACRHCFHVSCLDTWLKLNGSCPICRNSPLSAPLSTPLSEVMPLSQHAADRRRML